MNSNEDLERKSPADDPVKITEETTVVAKQVEEFGSSWYVDENRLAKSFNHGVWNPKTGDSIDLKLDSVGRVVAWKVKG